MADTTKYCEACRRNCKSWDTCPRFKPKQVEPEANDSAKEEKPEEQ